MVLVDLAEAGLAKVALEEAALAEAVLVEADLVEADLAEAVLAEVALVEADLAVADLAEADPVEVALAEEALVQAVLAEAVLEEAALVEVVTINAVVRMKSYLYVMSNVLVTTCTFVRLSLEQLLEAMASKSSNLCSKANSLDGEEVLPLSFPSNLQLRPTVHKISAQRLLLIPAVLTRATQYVRAKLKAQL